MSACFSLVFLPSLQVSDFVIDLSCVLVLAEVEWHNTAMMEIARWVFHLFLLKNPFIHFSCFFRIARII